MSLSSVWVLAAVWGGLFSSTLCGVDPRVTLGLDPRAEDDAKERAEPKLPLVGPGGTGPAPKGDA
ncbi:hypothetical protein ASD74_19275 [Rhizobium sp. Root564]|nr:hypothetical protein ASD74_19275 [Rhizobium sp. Root564]